MKQRFAHLSSAYPNSITLVASRPRVFEQHDVAYPYEAGPVFRWITKQNIPNCILLYAEGHVYTFLPEHNPKLWQWEGPQTDTLHPGALAGDHVYPLSAFSSVCAPYLTQAEYLIIDPQDSKLVQELHRLNPSAGPTHIDLDALVVHERAFLDDTAQGHVRAAIELTAASHTHLMRQARYCPHEQAMQGVFIQAGYAQGAQHLAYPPIMAAGRQACILHHQPNTQPVDASDWLLVDAGWRVQGYCADITRSYPIHHRPEGLRKAVYEALLHCHRQLIAQAQPDMTWRRMNQLTHTLIEASLADLGLKNGTSYILHGIGHWLGLEVHERICPKQSASDLPWKPNMLLTIEPGIYFPEHDEQLPETLRGFGLRLEDNLLITEQGAKNLSAHIPIDLDGYAHA